MRTTLRRVLGATTLILAVLALGDLPAAQAETGLLDGRTFEVEMGKKGEPKGTANTLTFRSGTFLSHLCVKYGFPQSKYAVTRTGSSIEFEVPALSDTDGHMDWTGTVTGDRLEATAVWHRPGHEQPIEFWIRGTRK